MTYGDHSPTMMFEGTDKGANLLITWEDVKVSLPVTL